jgi:transposase
VPRIKYQEAVGLSVKRGRPSVGLSPSKPILVKLYDKEGRSVRDVAAALGCSKDMVHRALKQYCIEVRTNIKRSRLRKYGYKTLKAATKKRGIRGAAQDLGVNASTLSRFLRSETEK